MKTFSKLLQAAAFCVLLLLAGCRSPFAARQPDEPAKGADTVFDYAGIPLREYYIGGGHAIRYIAQENGMLFLADDTEKRLLETISMHAGEEYETRYEIKDLNTVIKLYFVPESRL